MAASPKYLIREPLTTLLGHKMVLCPTYRVSVMKNSGLQMGPFVTIAGNGHISFFHGLTLQNVLHVPKMSYNLMSVSKITRDLQCNVTFSPDNVLFQNLSSGRTIGTAQHNRGLYLLDSDSSSSTNSKTSLVSAYFSTSQNDCMLWYLV